MPLQMLITDPVCFEDSFTGVAFWFIAEYVEQGALFDFLHRNQFDSDRNLQWAREIAAGRRQVYLPLLLGFLVVHRLFPVVPCCSVHVPWLFPAVP